MKTDEQIDERRRGAADRREGFLADELSDNDRIDRIIKKLEERPRKKRHKKKKKLLPQNTCDHPAFFDLRSTARFVFRHGFTPDSCRTRLLCFCVFDVSLFH